jgi:hypothetical protein
VESKMRRVSLGQFQTLVRSLDGRTLETESRCILVASIRRWDRYSETGSFKPGDYSDVSRNASYLLT